jgi:hypothetical protein
MEIRNEMRFPQEYILPSLELATASPSDDGKLASPRQLKPNSFAEIIGVGAGEGVPPIHQELRRSDPTRPTRAVK